MGGAQSVSWFQWREARLADGACDRRGRALLLLGEGWREHPGLDRVLGEMSFSDSAASQIISSTHDQCASFFTKLVRHISASAAREGARQQFDSIRRPLF